MSDDEYNALHGETKYATTYVATPTPVSQNFIDKRESTVQDAVQALQLNSVLQDEICLVYKVAQDNNLLILDWLDLKAVCNFLLERKELRDACYCNEKNLKDIMRAISIAEIKGIHLVNVDEQRVNNNIELNNVLTGEDFEIWCAKLLESNGYERVETTKGSGDHGVDILAEKNEITYAIQCKYYTGTVGNSAVQEAYSGKGFYNRDIAVVMTNSNFTTQAIEEANRLGVKLWDGNKIKKILESPR